MKNLLFGAMVLFCFTATAQYSVTQLCGFGSYESQNPIVHIENCAVNTLPTEISIPCLGLVICDLVSNNWIDEGVLHTSWEGDGVSARASRSESGFKMVIDDNGCRIVIQ